MTTNDTITALPTACSICGAPLHHKQPESLTAHYLAHISQSQAQMAADLRALREAAI